MSTNNAKTIGKSSNFKKNSLLTGSINLMPASQNMHQSSNRPSVLQNGASLSQVTGVNHLNDKRNSGLLLFKNQKNNNQRENKFTIDYYTVQNSKNTSTQPSTISTSRAQGGLSSQIGIQKQKTGNNNADIVCSDVSIIPPPTVQTQHQLQSSQPQQNSLIVNVTQGNSQKKENAIVGYHRGSIKTEQNKQRAMSSNKNVSQKFNQSQGQNPSVNLTWKGSSNSKQALITNTPSVAYGATGSKASYKNSMIVQSKLNASPNPSNNTANSSQKNIYNNIYRSPQHQQKQQLQNNSNSSSPLLNLNQNLQTTHNKNVSTSLVRGNTIQPQPTQQQQISVTTKNSSQNIPTIPIIINNHEISKSSLGHHPQKQQSRIVNAKASKTMTNMQSPSCLQIDLSSLSNRNDDEIAQIYGGGPSSIIQNQSSSQANVKKQQSLTGAKKTNSIISQSPSIAKSIACKSPINVNQNNNKMEEKKFKNKTNSTQKIGMSPKNINDLSKKEYKTKEASIKSNKYFHHHKSQKTASNNQISKKPSNKTFSKQEVESFDYQKSQNDIVESFNAGCNSHINHYLESEENNNIPEINSFNNIPADSKSIIMTNNNADEDEEDLDREMKEFPSYHKNMMQTSSFVEQERLASQQVVSQHQPLQSKEPQEKSDKSLTKTPKSTSTIIKSSIKAEKLTPIAISKTIQLIDWGDADDEPEELKVAEDQDSNKNNQNNGIELIKKMVFLEMNKEKMFNFEIAEIKELNQEFIYFAGQSAKRTQAELKLLKSVHEKQIMKDFDDEEGYYNVLLSDHLHYRYEILKILGKGSFAQVVQCWDHKTSANVAIKITRNTEIDHKFASSESRLLNFLMEKDPHDSCNIVRMIDEFTFREHHCFVFELLHSDLFEHLKENGFIGFPTGKIREFAIQILEALIFLEGHSIIHCDLKPENILLIDEQATRLKLVDYGSGCFRHEQVYTYVQSRFYRAPEVVLRIGYSEKVDIWSFGCILAELYTGEPLFPGNNEQEQLELIMEICGIPPASVIDKSRKKDHYFDTDYSPFLIEDEELGILRIPESKKLEDIVPCQDQLFLEFIKQCLELDPEKRMSAKQALDHPWLRDFLRSASPSLVNQALSRRREQDCDGVKGNAIEESPVRPIDNEKPKKSLSKIFNFQPVKIQQEENDSLCSTPKSEGGLQQRTPEKNKDSRFVIIGTEQVREELEVKKPHNNNKDKDKQVGKKMGKGGSGKDANIQLLGQYEIIREEEEITPSTGTNNKRNNINSEQSKVESSNNLTNINNDIINNENTINKITITVYQRRNNNINSNSGKLKKK